LGDDEHPEMGASRFDYGCWGNVVGNFTRLAHLCFIRGGTPVLWGFGIPQK